MKKQDKYRFHKNINKTIKKEPNWTPSKAVYQVNLGKDYQIELKGNMLYYRNKGSLIKAQQTPNNFYGSKEFMEHAKDLSEKLRLPITNAITGSAI